MGLYTTLNLLKGVYELKSSQEIIYTYFNLAS